MSLTLEITPELEHQLQQAAQAAGLTPAAYALLLLAQTLQSRETGQIANDELLKSESELIQQINQSLSAIEWQHYFTLQGKREAEMLSPEEHNELINLSDQIESANVARMQAVTALAHIRNTTIKALMEEFGLQPLANA
jgi:predicted metalloendopeptidase